MNDLISRQAAIDALTHKWDGMVASVTTKEAEDALNEIANLMA